MAYHRQFDFKENLKKLKEMDVGDGVFGTYHKSYERGTLAAFHRIKINLCLIHIRQLIHSQEYRAILENSIKK